MPSLAHQCGTSQITIKVGETKTWSIRADVDESQESQYEMTINSDPSVADVQPSEAFSAFSFGTFEIHGLKAGTASIVVTWAYAPNNASGICSFTVNVVDNAPPATSGNYPKSGHSGDPVNTYTGELVMEEPADLFLGGPMPLYFSRYYASHLNKDGVITTSLGANWMHNFDYHCFISSTNVDVIFVHGQRLQFQLVNNAWQLTAPLDVPYQLTTSGSNFLLASPLDGYIYQFDSTGLMTSISDRNGNTQTLTYNGSLLSQVSDGLGRTLTFTYQGLHVISTVSDGIHTINYGSGNYNTNSVTLYSVTNSLGGVTFYYYNSYLSTSDWLMSGKQLPNGNIPYTQTFDSSNRVATQSDASGNTYTYTYGTGVTTITDPLGKTRVHHHNANGQLISFTDESGNTSTFTYDSAGRRTTSVDRLSDTTTTTYHAPSGKPASITDPQNNALTYIYTGQTQNGLTFYDTTQITYPDGSTLHITYDTHGNPLTITGQANETWTYTYNSRGQMLTLQNPLGGVNTFTYNSDGSTATAKDNFNNTTTFSYDASRRLSQISYPDGHSKSYTYDAANQLLTETDENGKTTSYTYTPNGNTKTVTDPMNFVTGYNYNLNDRLVNITNKLGKVSSLYYSKLGQVTNMTSAVGELSTIYHDPNGRVQSIRDAAGKYDNISYDAEGVISAMTDARNKVWAYQGDKLGNVTQETSPLGYARNYAYDDMGRLVKLTDRLSHTTSYTYDVHGWLTSITLADGAQSKLTHNALGRITSVTDPNGNSWNTSFDADGRMLSQSDPFNLTTSYTYDSRSRPSVVTFPSTAGTLTFTYSPVGNVTRKLYSDTTDLNYTFDDDGRMLTADGLTLAYDAEGQITNCNNLTITRDNVGRVASVTYAAGKTVTYTYNNRGQVSQVADWVGGTTTLTYDDAGNVLTLTRPNGVVTTYTYNDDNRLTSIVESKSGTLSSIAFGRDAEGQVTSATRNTPQSQSLSASQQTQTFNIGSRNGSADYDVLARVTSDVNYNYTWDLASRVKSYTHNSATTTLTYDGMNNRISRTTNGVTRNYVLNYAFDLPSVMIVKQSNANLRYYVYLPDGFLLHSIEDSDSSRHFYHYSEGGTTCFLTDDNGTITDSYAVTPFGEVTSRTGTTDNPFVFRGAYGIMEEGLGLYYMRARYYDSASARFLSPDPVPSATPDAINPYEYAANNPLSYDDPTGQSFILDKLKKPSTINKIATKVVQSTLEYAARNSANDAISIYQAGLSSTPQLSNAVGFANASQTVGQVGKVVGVAINVYSEGSQASKEGKGALAIAGRGAAGGAAGLAVSIILPKPIALADSLTGGNIKQSLLQTYRVPEALLGNAQAGRAYEKAASSGDYGFVVQKANFAGEQYANNGFFNTVGNFFSGNFITETADGIGTAIFGPLPDPYVPPPITPRIKPYVSKRETPNKP